MGLLKWVIKFLNVWFLCAHNSKEEQLYANKSAIKKAAEWILAHLIISSP